MVLSPEAYDSMRVIIAEVELAERVALIEKGREDFDSGRTRDARLAIAEIAEKYGIEVR